MLLPLLLLLVLLLLLQPSHRARDARASFPTRETQEQTEGKGYARRTRRAHGA